MKKKVFFLLLISISLCLFNCMKVGVKTTERDIAFKITELIIKKDSLKMMNFSNEQFLHISSKKIGRKYFKTYVTLNGLKSKLNNSNKEEITIEGFKVFIYYNYNLESPFFVPDSKSRMFLTEIIDDQFFINKVEPIFSLDTIKKSKIAEPDF